MRILSFCLAATLATGCLPQEAVPTPTSVDNTAALEQRIDELEAAMDEQFASMDARVRDVRDNSVSAADLDVLTARVNMLSTIDIGGIESRIAALEAGGASALSARMDTLEATVATLSAATGGDPAMAGLVQALEDQLDDLDEALVALETSAASRSDLASLSTTVDDGIAELEEELESTSEAVAEVEEALAATDAAVAMLGTNGEQLAADLAALQGEFGTLDGSVSVLEDWTTSADTDLQGLRTDLIAVDDFSRSLDREVSQLQNDSFDLVRTSWVRTVLTEQDLRDALAELDGIRFIGDGTARINIPDGMEMDGVVVLDHPQGERISIVGNRGNRSAVELSFGEVGGFVIADGARLGMLDGMVLTGSSGAVGIQVRRDASMSLGSHVTIRDFNVGIRIEERGALTVENGCASSGDYDRVLVDEAVLNGVEVRSSSYFDAPDCFVVDSGNAGIYVRGNSFASMFDGAAMGSGDVGVNVGRASYFGAYGFDAADNGAAGFLVSLGSTVDATYATVQANEGNGINVSQGSVFFGNDSEIINNDGDGVVARTEAYVQTGSTVAGNGGRGVNASIGATVFGATSVYNNDGLEVLATEHAVCSLQDSAFVASEMGISGGGAIFTD